MSTKVVDGTLSVAYRTTVRKAGRVETVSVQGYVKGNEFGGGRIFADGKSKPLPQPRRETACGTITTLRLESADGTRFLEAAGSCRKYPRRRRVI